MDKPTFQAAMREKKVEVIGDPKEADLSASPDAPQAPKETTPTGEIPFDPSSFITVLNALRAVKRHRTTAPTNIPRNFIEQVEFFDDGVDLRLYVHVNGTWRYVALT